MATYSKKMGGKEVGEAKVYAPPHNMKGQKTTKADLGNGYSAEPTEANKVNMSVGNINRDGYSPEAKSTGTKIRGTGAATKGVMARGPMC